MIIPDVVLLQLSSWGWAHSCSKHVEDSNKHVTEEIVRQVGYLPERQSGGFLVCWPSFDSRQQCVSALYRSDPRWRLRSLSPRQCWVSALQRSKVPSFWPRPQTSGILNKVIHTNSMEHSPSWNATGSAAVEGSVVLATSPDQWNPQQSNSQQLHEAQPFTKCYRFGSGRRFRRSGHVPRPVESSTK